MTNFHRNTIDKALDRQYGKYGKGHWCAMCGKHVFALSAKPRPRKSFESGGSSQVDNCLILCPSCFNRVKDMEEIPYSMIPHFDSPPSDW